MRSRSLVAGGAATAGAALAWGWFEAGWVRLRELSVSVSGLPSELEGLRIAHLSDFHLGSPSRGSHAVERAVAWVEKRQPDLVTITGDLLARRAGEPALRAVLERLPGAFAVLGNHDYALSRDPFSEPVELSDLEPVTLLADSSAVVKLRGLRVQIAGLDPRAGWLRPANPGALVDPAADFRVLLTHVPRTVDWLRPGWFHLVLAGHMHGGQINVPYGRRKLRLAHVSARYTEGVYTTAATVMHVSPGLGTTFVPFRLLARPEATELVLQSTRD
jgi:predicted MPP superfamily phosphohydrolase